MKLVNYIRVSTQKQGQSGLGLEAQQFALKNYEQSVNGTVIHTYREIESGTDCARPELEKAKLHAKRIKGRLVIAKLDRLARNVHFISGLLESGVDFVNAESPNDDRFTIHIKAAMAEEEANKISQRTKAALAAAKRRGTLLGSARPGHWEGREARRLAGALKGAPKGGQANRARIAAEAEAIYAEALPIAHKLKDAGKSLRAIAKELNEKGFETLTGKPWNPMQVSRLLTRPN